MGRFDEKYTPEQRAAVGLSMLEEHPDLGRPLTAREATQHLLAGALGVPATSMPVTTAYDCKRAARRKLDGTQLSPLAKLVPESPDQARQTLTQRLVSLHEHQLERLEAQDKKGRVDDSLYRTVVRNHRDILATLRPPRAPRRPMNEPDKPPPNHNPQVSELLAAAQDLHRAGHLQGPAPAAQPSQDTQQSGSAGHEHDRSAPSLPA